MSLGLGLGMSSFRRLGPAFTGILDTYSGAEAAYSVRRLSGSYSDGLVRVRRSSDGTEQDIGYDGSGNLDETALTSFVGPQNLCLQSEDITTTWSDTRATLTANTTTAPDGTNTADKLNDDNSNPVGTGSVFVLQSVNVSANTQYTASVWLKADQLSFARILIQNYDGSTSGAQFFELTGAGVLGNVFGLDDSTITSYPNGWYRCTATWTQGVADTSFNFIINVADSSSNVNVDLDGTSSIFVWGAQVNEGATAQDYVKTTTTVAGDGFVTKWYDQSGNGYDAIQATAGSQPKIVSAGTVVKENGLPALEFDAVNDHLAASTAYDTQSTGAHFYVASSTGSNNRVIDTRGTGVTGTVIGWHHKFSGTDISIIDDGTTGILIQNISRLGQKLVSSELSLTQLREYTNSVLEDTQTGSLTSFDSGNPLYIGANTNGANNQLFGGKMQEIVLYNSDQSANRTGISDNINSYFNIYT